MTASRLSVYIRPADKWLFQALAAYREDIRGEYGINVTQSDAIVHALTLLLTPYKKAPESTPIKQGTAVRLHRSLRCPKNYGWVLERVDDIVRIKQNLGVKASFGHELLHLAQNTLIEDSPYGIMVRNMLASARAEEPK